MSFALDFHLTSTESDSSLVTKASTQKLKTLKRNQLFVATHIVLVFRPDRIWGRHRSALQEEIYPEARGQRAAVSP